MNLIKLSTVLYPSLPGPKYRRPPGSSIAGRLVLNVPLEPRYFGKSAKNIVIKLFEMIFYAGLISGIVILAYIFFAIF